MKADDKACEFCSEQIAPDFVYIIVLAEHRICPTAVAAQLILSVFDQVKAYHEVAVMSCLASWHSVAKMLDSYIRTFVQSCNRAII